MDRMLRMTLAVALTAAVAGNAWADRDEHRGGFREGERWEHHDRDGGHRERGDWGLPLGLLLFADVLARPPQPDLPPPVVVQPAYYPPPVAPVYVAPPAPVYAPPPAPVSYWYYCPSVGNYYPYVAQCPGGWQRVLPQPAQ